MDLDSYHINGGNPIIGEIECLGAKNGVLPIIAATILTKDNNLLSNCPKIKDVDSMLNIIRELGCTAYRENDGVHIDSKNLEKSNIPVDLMGKMRSSVFLLGPLLVRCKEVVIGKPGGCEIGKRPIDIHINALRQLGAQVVEEEQLIICRGKNLIGTQIVFDFPSVGATENIMMAALGAKGVTILKNCAREPEIVDLQEYLNKCGANISGAGTEQIVVNGPCQMHGAHYTIMSDRIEAGTFLIAAAMTNGKIILKNSPVNCMKNILFNLEKVGCNIKTYEDIITLQVPNGIKSIDEIVTAPYPAFPTDMQPQFLTLLCKASGNSLVRETIFENRFAYTEELMKMGADIQINEQEAIVKGKAALHGAQVISKDLRGGAALTIAGLGAEGITIVKDIEHIRRGYENFDIRLKSLGADIVVE